MRAWHFVGDTLKNGGPVPQDGELLWFKGKPILCEQGLHASLQPFDALKFAPGSTLCYVEVGGHIICSDDRLVATKRTIICRMDATDLLHYYTRVQALSVAHLWDIPDIVLEYLVTGEVPSARGPLWEAMMPALAPSQGPPSAIWAVEAAAWAAPSRYCFPGVEQRAVEVATAVRRAVGTNAPRREFNELIYTYFADWLE